MRTHYAHPADVLRKYNPQLTVEALEQEDYIQNDDLAQVVARIQDVESQFDSMTGRPMRATRVGSPGAPRTWEVQSAELYRNEYGAKVWLDNDRLMPIDSSKGDTIELRTGKDQWDDITDAEGDRWEADYEKGWIRVFARYRRSVHRKQLRDKFLRVTYRHGAQGGRHDQAGQTTLSEGVATGDMTMQVDEPTALRPDGVFFVGGHEYVRADSVDFKTGEVSLATRGNRGTTETQHDAGTTVHYCPLQLRGAVAGKAAVELLRYEDWVDELVDGGGYSVRDKMEDWEDEWSKTCAKFSGVRSM